MLPVYVVVGTVSVYSAMLVLSGTCYASVYGVPVLHVFPSCKGGIWILRSILDLLFFCVVLGSTADTCSASVHGVFHIRELVDYGSSGRFSTCFFSAFAWFNSGYKFLRQSTWLVFLVTTHLALFSFVVLRPLMLDIMAGMDQKDSFMRGFWWRCDVVWW